MISATDTAINVIVQNPDNINWLKDFIMPILGVMVGGFVTYFTSSRLLKKQLNFQITYYKKNQLQSELKVLTAIVGELKSNKVIAGKCLKIINENELDEFTFSQHHNFENTIYQSIRHEFLYLLNDDDIIKIHWIYYSVTSFLETKSAPKKIIDEFCTIGKDLITSLENIIADLKKELAVIQQ